MNRLVRLLFQAEELANQTRGWYYLHDRNQFPSLRAVLNARSDYVLSVEALAVPPAAAPTTEVGAQATLPAAALVVPARAAAQQSVGVQATPSIEVLDAPGRAANRRDAGVQVTREESGPIARNPSVSVVGPKHSSVIVIEDDSSEQRSEYQPDRPLSDELEPNESWYREQEGELRALQEQLGDLRRQHHGEQQE